MDEQLKQRLIGAAVVISLGVIFLPMVLDGGRHAEYEKIRIEIPAEPEVDYSSSIAPLTPPEVEISRIERIQPEFDEIDLQGQAPILDDELKEIIKPIEEPEEVVSSKGVDLREKKTITPPELKEEPQLATASKPEPRDEGPKAAPVKPAKVASVPLPAPSVVSAWVVQVGSFSSRDSAIGLRDRIRKQGFSAFVESFDKNGNASHRVRIGPETSRTRAEQTLARLKQKMKLEGIVVTYP